MSGAGGATADELGPLVRVSERLGDAPRREIEVGECGDLRGWLARIPDPRRAQGVRHPLVAVIGIACAAMLAGASSLAAIARWAAGADQRVLAAMGTRVDRRSGVYRAPSEPTIRRILRDVDADAVDQTFGGWLAAQVTDEIVDGLAGRAVLVDGKTVRGACTDDRPAPHLLAAMIAGDAAVVAQTEVGAKTNEITAFAPLLDGLDLTGAVVLADAMHTQREHARYLVQTKNAEFVMMVKDNQPRLFDDLDALPWRDVPVSHVEHDRGHGRDETRTIQVLPAPDDLPFPHVNQVFLIERHISDLAGQTTSNVAIFGVTSLTAATAHPARLAALVRSEWQIENGLHYRRDVTLTEDASQVRTGNTPRVMASLRNLTIAILKLFNWNNIKAALQWAAANHTRPASLLGFDP